MLLIRWFRPKRDDYWRNREWNMAADRLRNIALALIVVAIAYVYVLLLYFFQW